MMYLAKMRRAAMLLLLCALVVGMCNGEEASAEAAATETQDLKEKEEAEEQARLYEATRTMDWGSYYDPKGEFCGSYDCYKILGIDYYETMENGAMPSRSEITKRYRKLSRAWHPDKNRMAGAKARFVVRTIIVIKQSNITFFLCNLSRCLLSSLLVAWCGCLIIYVMS
jgi:hypothetical protein